MKTENIFAVLFLLLAVTTISNGQLKVEQWNRFAASFYYSPTNNGFTDITLSANFTSPDTTILVTGFYDGNGIYKVRFMPSHTGTWTFETKSNIPKLNGITGNFECVKSSENNHGIVQVSDTYHFKYADGKRYYPFGTTAYAWTHMSNELQETTLNTLEKTGFNKVRMCVFPKSYNLVKEEPELYPFEIKEIKKDKDGNEIKIWDYDKFNPSFFQHLEKRIDDLDRLGIEADLILFHPYDKGRWGFDQMPMDVNLRYLDYITSRLASFKNVWWSLANEWDFIKSKTITDWKKLTKRVVANDPYGHLCSIHGSTAKYFDYWEPEFTHVSVQDEAPVQTPTSAAMIRNIYHKPVICDEVGYEGNLKSRWGRHSPEEMTSSVLNGVMGGIYVTHGETYMFKNEADPIFWAEGGILKGTSWKHIAFLKNIIEEIPNPLQLADVSRDNRTTTAGNGYYFVNFGEEIKHSWIFNLPNKNASFDKPKAGTRFKVDIINIWDMTITEHPSIFEITEKNDYRMYDKDFKKIYLPQKPYIILRIKEIE